MWDHHHDFITSDTFMLKAFTSYKTALLAFKSLTVTCIHFILFLEAFNHLSVCISPQ